MPALTTFSPYRTEIAGHDVKELAKKFGTPVYVYDAAKIKERIDDLKAFDVVRYAQKACSNIAILDLMRRKGVVVDAVSAGEVARAVAAGFPYHGDPHPIIYTADIFDRGSLALVVEKGLPVNCGSPDMISQLGEAAPGRGITLRINPGFGHGHSQKTNTGGKQSKHGIWHAELDHCIRLADHYGLSIEGLHMHIGSGTDLEHLSQVCGAMQAACEKVGRTIKTVSHGGGLPIPYNEKQTYVDLDKYFELWDATRTKLEQKFGHKISLEIEPGRYLVAESGFLVSEIRAIKQMDDNTFYLLDAGFNNLARPILYGSYHPMSIAVPESTPMRKAIVGGPLCESGDIFTQTEGGFVCARDLPSAQVGDMLVIECAGAYGHVMASNYNSKPLTAEVLLEEGEAHLIRVRQTPEDILRGERIPARA